MALDQLLLFKINQLKVLLHTTNNLLMKISTFFRSSSSLRHLTAVASSLDRSTEQAALSERGLPQAACVEKTAEDREDVGHGEATVVLTGGEWTGTAAGDEVRLPLSIEGSFASEAAQRVFLALRIRNVASSPLEGRRPDAAPVQRADRRDDGVSSEALVVGNDHGAHLEAAVGLTLTVERTGSEERVGVSHFWECFCWFS